VPAGRDQELAETLRGVVAEALRLGDPETAAYAANDAASILRDSGHLEEALQVIAEILDQLKWVLVPFPAFSRLGKTIGSILSISDDPRILTRADAVLKRLDSWEVRETRAELPQPQGQT
jgi:hypothetical protein